MNARVRFGVVAMVLLLASVFSAFAAGGTEASKVTKGQNIDTLVVAMGADARSLDPHATNDQPSARVMKLV